MIGRRRGLVLYLFAGDLPMSDREHNPQVVAQVDHEANAAVLVSLLESHGIRARAVGGFISDFKAGAPGAVQVTVAAEDAERAKEILRNQRDKEDAPD